MTKILIVYDSETGNTEKMAYIVLEGVKKVEGVEALLKKADQTSLEDLQQADGIILGSPTYYGQMSSKLKELIDKSTRIHGKLVGKVGGAFTSSGGTACGAETTLLSILEAMLIHGMIIQGRADNKHYGAAVVGAPTKKDEIDVCQELGKRIATLVKKITQ